MMDCLTVSRLYWFFTKIFMELPCEVGEMIPSLTSFFKCVAKKTLTSWMMFELRWLKIFSAFFRLMKSFDQELVGR